MVFKLENITKQFSEKFILQDFSFEIASGEKINISGRSGIGKTTLFRLLLGYEKPDRGKMYFNGELLNDENVWEVRKKVAYVSQDLSIGHGKVRNLFDETLNYKANIHQKKNSGNDISNYLSFFELPENVLDKIIEELSGGEKQRIAILNALILKRTIFFLDEASSALDFQLKKKVLDFFLSKSDFTVLYISHDDYLPANSKVRILKLDNYD